MKKSFILLLVLSFYTGTTFSQSDATYEKPLKGTGKFVFMDLNAGAHFNNMRKTQNYKANPVGFHGDIGVGYMFDRVIGLKASFGYDLIGSKSDTITTKSNIIRASLEGIFSVTNAANFGGDKFGLNIHGGFGWSRMWNKDYTSLGIEAGNPGYLGDADDMGNYIIGITPMLNLSDQVALSLDYTYLFLAGSDINVDYRDNHLTEVSGYSNLSLGIVYNFK